jgi:hypothetical protein
LISFSAGKRLAELIQMRTTNNFSINRRSIVKFAYSRKPTIAVWLVVAICVAFAGCSREPFELVQASGRLTYEDGTPLPTKGGLRIVFAPTAPPINGDMFPPRGTAYPDENGNFASVSTSRPGGMVRGEQKVAVMYQDVDSKRFVPREYTSPKTTPLVVNTDNAPFDIKVPRPKMP